MNFSLLLSLATAYEYCINEDASRAFSELDKSITILENEKNDAFLNKYKKSFQHVVYSTKLFVKKDILTNSEFVKVNYLCLILSHVHSRNILIRVFNRNVKEFFRPHKHQEHFLFIFSF